MLRVAVLGTGRMARAHCARLAAIPGVTIAAVISRRGGCAASLPGAESARCIESVAALRELVSPVDVALVCLPSHLHRKTVEELTIIVPHIICEKPAALSHADALAMSQAAKAAGCNLMIAQVLRTWDSYTTLAALLRARQDTLHSVSLRRRQPRPAWSENDWLLDSTQSGGILYDLAIHDIDFITSLYGTPQSIAGHVAQGGMSATLLLGYPGFCAAIQSSWTLPGSYRAGLDVGAEVVFDNGLALFGQEPDRYQLYEGTTQRLVSFPTWEPYDRQLEDMLNYVRTGQRENPFSIATTLPALAVCDQIRLSHG